MLLLQPVFAQLSNICALETDRIDQMNQTLVDLLALNARQQEQISSLNQQAFTNFCSLRTQVTVPGAAGGAPVSLTIDAAWTAGTDHIMAIYKPSLMVAQVIFFLLMAV